MIAYLEGTLLKKETDRIILLANQVGYEVLVPLFVMEAINAKSVGDTVSLFIYYHQTERQPKPVLIGFHLEAEREFFLMFISVEAIGPLKAIKALNLSVRDIARAIESKNLEALKRLNGIGDRTARKIIATLQGKMGKFSKALEKAGYNNGVESGTAQIVRAAGLNLFQDSCPAELARMLVFSVCAPDTPQSHSIRQAFAALP